MERRFHRFVIRYLEAANRRRLRAIIGTLIATAVAVGLASQLKLKSDLKELLPQNSLSVVELNRVIDRIGGVGTLIVVAESSNVEANKRFMDDLASSLSTLPPGTIRYVNYKADEIRKFYEDHFIYYIDTADLELLYKRLKKRVDYEKVKRLPMFLELEDEEEDPMKVEIDDIVERNEKNYSAPLETVDDYYGGEWGRMLIMVVRPYGTTMTVDAARNLVKTVQGKVNELGPANYDSELNVGYCGNVVSTVEEYDTLKKDVLSTALLCVALVAGIIVIYFLRLRVVLILGATLLVAIAWTFAVTRLAIGYLNAQTAFLGSIIVGTGINYGIIVLGRYLEERKKQTRPMESMAIALETTIKPTFLAAATTAVAFLVLMLARIRGLSQFGFIGAVGVMFCWLAAIFLLPPMTLATERIRRLIKEGREPKRQSALFELVARLVAKVPVIVVSFATVVVVVATVIVMRAAPHSIEYDFSKMRNKISVSSGTEALEKRVSKLFKNSMTPSVVLVDSPEEGAKVCEAVDNLAASLPDEERRIGSCYSINDLLPADQDKKLPILQKIKNLVDPRYINKIDKPLRDQVKRIEKSLTGRPLAIDDLPVELTRHFEDLYGNRGVVAFINPRPGMLLSDGRNLMKYAETIRTIRLPDGRIVHAAGESLIYSDLINIIKREAPVLTIASLLGVLLFVFIMLKRMRLSIIVSISLLWGVMLMMGVAAYHGIKINFFNFIVLPLTFGIGVDYALNMAIRLKKDASHDMANAIRHTGGAVILCSATTIIGYFVLTLAKNQALATFGLTAVIGEITCLGAAIVLVPALMLLLHRPHKKW